MTREYFESPEIQYRIGVGVDESRAVAVCLAQFTRGQRDQAVAPVETRHELLEDGHRVELAFSFLFDGNSLGDPAGQSMEIDVLKGKNGEKA